MNKFWSVLFLFSLSIPLSHALLAEEIPENQKAFHVLNRLAYGPTSGDLDKVESKGVETYINEQLSPEKLREPDDLMQKLSKLQTLRMNPIELFKKYAPPIGGRKQKKNAEAFKAARKESKIIMEEAIQARILRAVESRRQLQEVMVDFWFNHFNVFAKKGLDHLWVGSFEEQAIRPHVMGRFRDLLEATAKHPAMLFYLDNWQNTAPGLNLKRKKFQGLNENYARELMELHTLGVDGGYTQQDVIALAKILTGWGFTKPGRRQAGSAYAFEARRHDYSNKVFLGHLIQGQGEAEGEEALDMLARSPATAHHISYKLAQYFVSDKPDPALVEKMAKQFLETDGDIRQVLDFLFHSPEFWDQKTYGGKLKTPYQYLISTLRITSTAPDNFRLLYGTLNAWGMPLYGCLTPDGYKNTEEAWLNSDNILKRISFATALSKGDLPVSDIRSGPVSSEKIGDGFENFFSDKTKKVIQNSPPGLKAAAMLGSPEFMRR